MSKCIKRSISKADIAVLPTVVFEGQIVVINNEIDAEKAVAYLLKQKMVGVDTETRPSFVRGKLHKVALLQVSSLDTCFLFRLNQLGNSPSIKRLLEDSQVVKVGLSLKDDIGALRKRETFTPGEFLELQTYVKEFGIEDLSLQKIYAILFEQRISKSQRLSNWEAEVLNEKQQLYAATDAWACLVIYQYLEQLKRTGEYQLEEKKGTNEKVVYES